MKKTSSAREPGAVLVFAVLLLGAGIFVLAAVAQLAATQGVSGEADWIALQRRVTLANSRALAREYVLSRMFRTNVPELSFAGGFGYTNAQLGGFELAQMAATSLGGGSPYWTTVSTTNTNVVININPFNLMERGGFYREIVPGNIWDGNNNIGWSFQIRTRSPVAAGYSFVQHRPAGNDLLSMATPPYIDLRTDNNEQIFGFHGLPRTPLASVGNTNTRSFLGFPGADINGYQGFLDVVEGASTAGMFTNVTYELRGQGNEIRAVVDLDAFDAYTNNNPVLRYTVPPTSTDGATNGPVTEVRLVGTPAYDRKPLHVVVPSNNPNVRLLTLTNDNARLVYFYLRKPANDGILFDVASLDAGSWRLGITMSQSDIQFDIGNLEVIGGLRTDSRIILQGGSVNFVPELDPGGLDFIADRVMWLEDYRAQQ